MSSSSSIQQQARSGPRPRNQPESTLTGRATDIRWHLHRSARWMYWTEGTSLHEIGKPTTSRYLSVKVEELFDKLTEHYTRPKPQTHFPTGYAAADLEAVFGA